MERLDSSFGDLLRSFRHRKKMTQQVLADLLGKHRNTISIWERGDFLPESKTTVLEIARQLNLDQQETRALLEAGLIISVPYWSVPYCRNPFFTGREKILDKLSKPIVRGQTVALTGLGGVGKTQIAVEFAYRHTQEYTAVFLINSETQVSILASLGSIATVLRWSWQHANDQHLLGAINQWLATHQDWLLIVDNIEQPDLVKSLLAAIQQGSILCTTRLPSLETLAPTMVVEPMTEEESIQFLLRRTYLFIPTHEQHLEEEARSAHELAVALGGLPLALDQVGAYIQRAKCSFTDLLACFRHSPIQLLQERQSYADHPISVVKTFVDSFEKLQQVDITAAELLICCCFLAAEEIPEELFSKHASHISPILQTLAASPHRWNEACKDILFFALFQRDPYRETISVHRLVQTVLRDQCTSEQQHMWERRILHLLDYAFPHDPTESTSWFWCEQLLPHVLHCLEQTATWASFSPEYRALLKRSAEYLFACAQYTRAESLYQQAFALQRQAQSNHADLFPLLFRLAQIKEIQGNYLEAEALCQHASFMLETLRGQSGISLLEAENLNNLALISIDQGSYERAERLLQLALVIYEQHPEKDSKIVECLNSLGVLYCKVGKHEQAGSSYLRALAICEQQLGTDCPETAHTWCELATLFSFWKQYAQADALFQKALPLYTRHYGEQHPHTAHLLNNLAGHYRQQKKYAQAEPLFQRALAIRQTFFGEEHHQTALSISGLGLLYLAQGKYEQAESFLRNALEKRERLLGVSHHDTAESMVNLARVYMALEQHHLASPLYQRALATLQSLFPAEDQEMVEVHKEFGSEELKQDDVNRTRQNFGLGTQGPL